MGPATDIKGSDQTQEPPPPPAHCTTAPATISRKKLSTSNLQQKARSKSPNQRKLLRENKSGGKEPPLSVNVNDRINMSEETLQLMAVSRRRRSNSQSRSERSKSPGTRRKVKDTTKVDADLGIVVSDAANNTKPPPRRKLRSGNSCHTESSMDRDITHSVGRRRNRCQLIHQRKVVCFFEGARLGPDDATFDGDWLGDADGAGIGLLEVVRLGSDDATFEGDWLGDADGAGIGLLEVGRLEGIRSRQFIVCTENSPNLTFKITRK